MKFQSGLIELESLLDLASVSEVVVLVWPQRAVWSTWTSLVLSTSSSLSSSGMIFKAVNVD